MDAQEEIDVGPWVEPFRLVIAGRQAGDRDRMDPVDVTQWKGLLQGDVEQKLWDYVLFDEAKRVFVVYIDGGCHDRPVRVRGVDAATQSDLRDRSEDRRMIYLSQDIDSLVFSAWRMSGYHSQFGRKTAVRSVSLLYWRGTSNLSQQRIGRAFGRIRDEFPWLRRSRGRCQAPLIAPRGPSFAVVPRKGLSQALWRLAMTDGQSRGGIWRLHSLRMCGTTPAFVTYECHSPRAHGDSRSRCLARIVALNIAPTSADGQWEVFLRDHGDHRHPIPPEESLPLHPALLGKVVSQVRRRATAATVIRECCNVEEDIRFLSEAPAGVNEVVRARNRKRPGRVPHQVLNLYWASRSWRITLPHGKAEYLDHLDSDNGDEDRGDSYPMDIVWGKQDADAINNITYRFLDHSEGRELARPVLKFLNLPEVLGSTRFEVTDADVEHVRKVLSRYELGGKSPEERFLHGLRTAASMEGCHGIWEPDSGEGSSRRGFFCFLMTREQVSFMQSHPDCGCELAIDTTFRVFGDPQLVLGTLAVRHPRTRTVFPAAWYVFRDSSARTPGDGDVKVRRRALYRSVSKYLSVLRNFPICHRDGRSRELRDIVVDWEMGHLSGVLDVHLEDARRKAERARSDLLVLLHQEEYDVEPDEDELHQARCWLDGLVPVSRGETARRLAEATDLDQALERILADLDGRPFSGRRPPAEIRLACLWAAHDRLDGWLESLNELDGDGTTPLPQQIDAARRYRSLRIAISCFVDIRKAEPQLHGCAFHAFRAVMQRRIGDVAFRATVRGMFQRLLYAPSVHEFAVALHRLLSTVDADSGSAGNDHDSAAAMVQVRRDFGKYLRKYWLRRYADFLFCENGKLFTTNDAERIWGHVKNLALGGVLNRRPHTALPALIPQMKSPHMTNVVTWCSRRMAHKVEKPSEKGQHLAESITEHWRNGSLEHVLHANDSTGDVYRVRASGERASAGSEWYTVDLERTRCTCPTRRRPCKHVEALMLLSHEVRTAALVAAVELETNSGSGSETAASTGATGSDSLSDADIQGSLALRRSETEREMRTDRDSNSESDEEISESGHCHGGARRARHWQVTLYQHEVLALEHPESLLSDGLVDYALQHANRRYGDENSCLVLSCGALLREYDTARQGHPIPSSAANRFTRAMEAYPFVLVPVSDGCSAHFVVALVDMRGKKMIFYDPLGPEAGQHRQEALRQALGSVLHVELDATPFRLGPRQRDNHNCGPYCIAIGSYWLMCLSQQQFLDIVLPPREIRVDPTRVRRWLRMAIMDNAPVPDFAPLPPESESMTAVPVQDMLSQPWVKPDDSDSEASDDDSQEEVFLVSESETHGNPRKRGEAADVPEGDLARPRKRQRRR